MQDWLLHFARAAEGKGSKSTVLQPIMYMVAILGTLLYAITSNGSPVWLQIAVGVALAVMLLLFVAAYSYFSLRDPNCLRSERFNIRKMEIEQASIGDTDKGIVTLEQRREIRTLLNGAAPDTDALNGVKG